MLSGYHETPQYQDFLISESRRGLIPPDLYDALIPKFQDDMVILDFGCGSGYLCGFYSEKFKEYENFKIFACDYQVEILDSLWRRIVENKFKNVTPFFMPYRSRLHFPKWILPADHVFCSLSLSTTENPIDILNTMKAILKPGALIHIIDWDKDKEHPLINDLVPVQDRLSLGQIKKYLARAEYDIVRQYKITGPYYAMTVSPVYEKEETYSPEPEQETKLSSPAESDEFLPNESEEPVS